VLLPIKELTSTKYSLLKNPFLICFYVSYLV